MSHPQRYVHECEGCGGSYAECQAIWAEQRKCCPDCTHHRAHPPPGSWRDFLADEPSQFDKAREADPQMEAGHA